MKNTACQKLNACEARARFKKASSGKSYRIHIEGWSKPVLALDRVLIKCSDIKDMGTYNELLDDWGFRRNDIEGHPGILHIDDLLKLDGGLIVDDGDSGKTVFLRQLENRLRAKELRALFIKMRDYRGQGDRELLEKIHKFSRGRKQSYILLDALDEAPDIVESLFNKIAQSPKKIHWWITTRPLLHLSTPQEHTLNIQQLKLLPFSVQEARKLVGQLCVHPDAFFESVIKMEVQEFCLKPGGLIVLLRIYTATNSLGRSRRQLMDLVVKDYCTPRRDGKIDEAMPISTEVEDKLIDITGWLALCMILSGSDQCWFRDIASTPNRCVALRKCISERYSFDELSMSLATRFIEPMGRGFGRIAYSPLMSGYLAARWLNGHVSLANIEVLLRVSAPKMQRPVLEIQRWMAVLNRGFIPQGISKAPECFLNARDAIESIGFERFYNYMESRYAELTFEEKRDQVINRLLVFNDFDVAPIVEKKLMQNDSSKNAIEFASMVARRCRLEKVVPKIIDIVADPKRPVDVRSTLSYDLVWLRDELKEAIDFRPLKVVLSEVNSGMGFSNVFGNVLDCLWPDCLLSDELVRYLRNSVRQAYFGAYERFIEYSLPDSFNTKVDKTSVMPMLKWAVDHVAEDKPFDRLGELARKIFTYAWKYAADKNIAVVLADCILAYSKKSYRHEVPISECDRTLKNKKCGWKISVNRFWEDVSKRMSILRILLQRPTVTGEDISLFGLPYVKFALYSEKDFTNLFKEWEKAYCHDHDVADRWAFALMGALPTRKTRNIKTQLGRLAEIYPTNQKFQYQAFLDRLEYQKKNRREILTRERREEQQNKEIERRHTSRIKTTLKKKSKSAVLFLSLSYVMSSKDGRPKLPENDVTATVQWEKLDNGCRKRLLELAILSLRNYPKYNPDDHGQDVALLCAMRFVWRKRKSEFARLTAEESGLLAKVIFRNASNLKGDKVIVKLLDCLSERFPNECFAAVKECTVLECKNGFGIGVGLQLWGSHLSVGQFRNVLDELRTSTDGYGKYVGKVFEAMSQICFVQEEARHYFSSVINYQSKKVPNKDCGYLLRIALKFFPKEYGEYLLRLTRANSRWVKQWLLNMASRFDAEELANAFFTAGPKLAFEMIVWLENNFPENKRPQHDAVYSPSPKDVVYELKDIILLYMMKYCDEQIFELLQTLPKKCVNRAWDYFLLQCQATIRNNLLPDTLDIEEIKSIPILEKPSSMSGVSDDRWFVRDGKDLLNVIVAAIKKYEHYYLHGHKFAAIPDLWCFGNKSFWQPKRKVKKWRCIKSKKKVNSEIVFPKWEDHLSDHLARFLDIELKKAIVNRETQATPLMYRNASDEAKVGYSDISVECALPNRKLLVIVEVKGNWNRDVKHDGLIKQLQGHYLSVNQGAYGILVCGCFNSKSWCVNDWRRHLIVTGYETKESAQRNLDKQLESADMKERMAVMAIDCGLNPKCVNGPM
ncbi:MAG: hypothetical protein IKD78_02330 [Bacteroidales bacterium]|nr:hypothetical protein [Bacteroidales bacterium]